MATETTILKLGFDDGNIKALADAFHSIVDQYGASTADLAHQFLLFKAIGNSIFPLVLGLILAWIAYNVLYLSTRLVKVPVL